MAPSHKPDDTPQAPGSVPGAHMRSRPLLRLFAVLAVELIGFGMVIPVLPYLCADYGGDALMLGLLFGVQFLGQFVMAPVWGALSDRFGRRRIMIATLLAAAVASLLTALVAALPVLIPQGMIRPGLWVGDVVMPALFLVRLLAGVAAGNVSTASAYVADVTDAKTRSKGMAVIGISFAVGFTIGPGVGGILSGDYGVGVPFFAAVLISALNALMAVVLLDEPLADRAVRQEARGEQRSRYDMRNVLGVLKDQQTRTICAVNLMYTVAITFLEAPFTYYMKDVFEAGPRQVGYIMAGLGIVVALFQGGAVGRISARVGDRKMTMGGLVILAIGLLLAPLWANLTWLLVVLLGASIGRAFAQPGLLSLASRSGKAEETGKRLGVYQSAASLGRIVGPAIGGAVYAFVGVGAPFVLACALLLAAVVYWSRRPAPAKAAAPAQG